MTTQEHVTPSPTPLEVALNEIETLNEAMASRGTIGQAIGILMVEMSITDEDAFAHLVAVSSRTNTKLRVIADDVVQKANRRAAGRSCDVGGGRASVTRT